jgi:hypothetical protein
MFDQLIQELRPLLPHRFEKIIALGDGTKIPAEALSEDHTIGIYGQIIPRLMRNCLAEFREVQLSDFLPQSAIVPTSTGYKTDLYLEYPPLRNTQFRTEKLQYIESGWWAITADVKYPLITVMTIAAVIKKLYGNVYLYINIVTPMPLWFRATPMNIETPHPQVVIQARGEDRILFTNIHTECSIEYSRQWEEAIKKYYRVE